MTAPTPAARRGAFAMLFAAMCIWSASFIATKLALLTMPPFACALARFGVASAILVVAHLVTRTPWIPPRATWKLVAIAGLTGTTATYVLENYALTITTAGNSALMVATSPLMLVVGSTLVLGERLAPRQWAGLALAVTGMLGLVGPGLHATGQGDALMALVALVGLPYGLSSKPLSGQVSPLVALSSTTWLGTAGLVPFVVAEGFMVAPWWPSPAALAAIAYLAVLSSALAYGLWFQALRSLPMSEAAPMFYLMPVGTLLLSATALAEPLTALRAGAALAILVGVYLATAERPTPTPVPLA